MPIFLSIPSIPGESLDKDHKDAIDAGGYSWGLSNPGSAAGKKAAPPSFSDLIVEKQLDRATTGLAMACASGLRLRRVLLDETASTTDAGRVTFLTIQLWDAVVTDLQAASAAEDRPNEVVAFQFPKVEVVYTLFDDKGKKKGTERFAWDLVNGGSF